MSKPGKERVLSSKRSFTGKLLRVRVDEVMLPNGNRTKREIVEHRGAVAIIAIDKGNVLLERQYRHAAGRVMWEIPAGTLEEGETPKDAALRELGEETGFSAEMLTELTHFYVAVGYSTEVIRVFFAEGLTRDRPRPEEDEAIESVMVPMDEALRMVSNNEIEDAKTIIGLLMAKERVGNDNGL